MKFEIIIGSVLGASEYVAEAAQTMLEEQGHSAQCHFKPTLSDIDLSNPMLVVTSTHGAGELPDNIQPFAKAIESADLSSVKALVIGLGDSSYDTFCEGSRIIATTIESSGGRVLKPVFQIDVLHHPIPEDTAVAWLADNYASLL